MDTMKIITKQAIAYYVDEAEKVNAKTKTVAQLRKALRSMLYTASELSTDEKVIATAKDVRTALLHRARAVKSSAKRREAQAA
jgi:hypothetical protein